MLLGDCFRRRRKLLVKHPKNPSSDNKRLDTKKDVGNGFAKWSNAQHVPQTPKLQAGHSPLDTESSISD